MTEPKPATRQIHLVVEPSDEGLRLDKYLSKKIQSISRTRLKALVKEGLVTVNGVSCLIPKQRVVTGQEVSVTVPEPEPDQVIATAMDLEILFEDEHLIAINKPPGMVVHPGAGNTKATLVHGVLHHCKGLSVIGGKIRPGVVHRLDKDTSGVIVMAKNDVAHLRLSELFKDRRVKKHYLAIISGHLPDRQGIVDKAIGRHPVRRTKMAIDEKRGRSALTKFWVERDLLAAQLVRIRIFTGRTHQIRVHMAHLGHPILGDATYGGPKVLRAGPEGKEVTVPRQMLHAANLEMVHPVLKNKIYLEAPLPKDMMEILKMLSGDLKSKK